ncbi:hypothetical protein KAR91_09425 [Candidatus Pacearchaeota archaeon]|nr:hypothetical protein [Candidatus Pacearchaeota archaeon]
MIPNKRSKPQQASGFPIEEAKRLYAMFGPDGQDIPFAKFYEELCGIADPDKMEDDLDEIHMVIARERSNRLLIDRVIEHDTDNPNL